MVRESAAVKGCNQRLTTRGPRVSGQSVVCVCRFHAVIVLDLLSSVSISTLSFLPLPLFSSPPLGFRGSRRLVPRRAAPAGSLSLIERQPCSLPAHHSQLHYAESSRRSSAS